MNDLRPILRVVSVDVVNQIKRGFQSGAAPDGSAWRPLSETTLSRRRRGGEGAQILRDTGRLMRSVVSSFTPTSLVVGTNLVYAKTQNYGRSSNRMYGRAPAPIPARRFMLTGSEIATQARIARIRRWILTGSTVP